VIQKIIISLVLRGGGLKRYQNIFFFFCIACILRWSLSGRGHFNIFMSFFKLNREIEIHLKNECLSQYNLSLVALSDYISDMTPGANARSHDTTNAINIL
jgi:hypothetical protein